MAASRMPYLAAVSQDGEAYPLLAKVVVRVPGGLVAWLNTTTVAIDKIITYLPRSAPTSPTASGTSLLSTQATPWPDLSKRARFDDRWSRSAKGNGDDNMTLLEDLKLVSPIAVNAISQSTNRQFICSSKCDYSPSANSGPLTSVHF
eukprot:TRINITY_DN5431_c0_g1_i2.p1 TRINITY_DN5431_c0_g1~~TRINITY_DN5431_c0_g1_i2.p1  ORF type:complete len:147 (-),score=1.51 TRINITY_DN5431_c0_g1_i2:1-441(-)